MFTTCIINRNILNTKISQYIHIFFTFFSFIYVKSRRCVDIMEIWYRWDSSMRININMHFLFLYIKQDMYAISRHFYISHRRDVENKRKAIVWKTKAVVTLMFEIVLAFRSRYDCKKKSVIFDILWSDVTKCKKLTCIFLKKLDKNIIIKYSIH